MIDFFIFFYSLQYCSSNPLIRLPPLRLPEKVFRLEMQASEDECESDATTEKGGLCPLTDDLWVISFMGRDRPGLIRDILNKPALQNVNIVDMDQKVMQGICIMTVVADFASADITPGQLEE